MITNAALTYNLSDFIEEGKSDEITYKNFSIVRATLDAQFTDVDIIDHYIDELKAISVRVETFTEEDVARYKYQPDLLAYDLYNSTQLDFILMLVNGIIDPKEFDFNRGYLLIPPKKYLKQFLSEVYNAERKWLNFSD